MSVGFCLSSIPGRAVALWGHAALVPGQFLVSGGAAAFAGRLRPSEFLPGQSRAARSPFGVMPRWSRDNFCLSQAARSPWLVALRTPYGAISCFWEVLGRSGGALASPPAGNFLLGGDAGLHLRCAHVPSFLCSGGVRSPGEVGVLGHPGLWCRPGAGLALSPGSQGVSRRALHSLRGPGPAPQTQKLT